MKWILYILFWLISICSYAQEQTDSTGSKNDTLHTDIHAAIVVVTPGNTPACLLGHLAIRMWCPSAGLDYCFTGKIADWGNEFVTSTFKRVKEGLIPEETRMFRDDYRIQGRGITEYELDLTLDEKRKLWMFLDKETSLGLFRDMDYVKHGCATIAVDNILAAISERNLDLNTIIDKCVIGNTRREILLRYKGYDTWEGFIGHSVFGGTPDEEVNGTAKLIMPQDVITVFDTANLVLDRHVICKPSIKAEDSTPFSPIVFGVLFLLICCLKFKVIDYPVMLLQTLIGLLLCTIVFISPAPGTEWNWLIIAFNPIMSVIFWLKKPWINIALCIILMMLMALMIIKINSMFCITHILIIAGLCMRNFYRRNITIT